MLHAVLVLTEGPSPQLAQRCSSPSIVYRYTLQVIFVLGGPGSGKGTQVGVAAHPQWVQLC